MQYHPPPSQVQKTSNGIPEGFLLPALRWGSGHSFKCGEVVFVMFPWVLSVAWVAWEPVTVGTAGPSHDLNPGSGLHPFSPCRCPYEIGVSWLRLASGRHMSGIPVTKWENQVHLEPLVPGWDQSASPKSTRAGDESWSSPLHFKVDSPIKVTRVGRVAGRVRLIKS